MPAPLPPSVQADLELALEEVLSGRTPADRSSRALLRAHPELDNQGRADVAQTLFGVACYARRLDYLLEGAGRAPRMAARIETYRKLAEHGALDAPAPSALTHVVDRIARWHSYPLWWARRLREVYGERAEAEAAAFNRPGPLTLRANRLRTDRTSLAKRLREQEGVATRPSSFAPDALVVEGRLNVRGASAWREGWFEVQDAGSQCIADAVGARRGERVLDLCAGAGGKTLALAAAMQNEGELWACDVEESKLANLRARAKRAGVTCVRTVRLDPDDDALDALPAAFDRVLIDAPCSSSGTLRRGPDLKWRLAEREVAAMAELQRVLLARGVRRVTPGGRLVYATCSVFAEENEMVWARFLDENPAIVAQGEGQRLSPDVTGTDGFFIVTAARS